MAAMRNFWIDGAIDGRENNITGGPRNKEGGFDLEIRQKDEGSSVFGVRVVGKADSQGNLVLRVLDDHNKTLFEKYTKVRGSKK